LHTYYTTGFAEAIKHLEKLRHRKIAFISGPEKLYTTQLRVEAFRFAMLSNGLKVRPELMQEGDWRMQSGIAAMQRLLRGKHPFTAIICSNDEMAIGAIRAVHSAGMRVPEDISVVGIDDLMAARLAEPPLTTIRVPRHDIARIAFQKLVELSSRISPHPCDATVSTSLVVRESTGRAPSMKPASKSETLRRFATV
jgi:DNA-binding LacI/PurR family transcriptional regulator